MPDVLYECHIDREEKKRLVARIMFGFPLIIIGIDVFLIKTNNYLIVFSMLTLLFLFFIVYVIIRKKIVDYYFTIDEYEIHSQYGHEENNELTYSLKVSKISQLLKTVNSSNVSNSYVTYELVDINNLSYTLSSNFIYPDKVFDIVMTLRPELQVTLGRI